MKNTGSLSISEPYKEGFDGAVNTISAGLTNCEKVCQNGNSKEPAWKLRYVVTIIGFLLSLSTSIHRTIMSVVIVAMVNNTAIVQTSQAKSVSCPDLIANTTDDFTLHHSRTGMPGLCVTILMANWCPKTERGFLFSIIMTSHSLGPVLGDIFAGYISESPGGWPYVFYTLGVSGLALAAYISFFIAESPEEHPRITKAELDFILSQQESKLSRRRPKLPWRQMLSSVPLYALMIAMFGRTWKFSQFSTVHSTFLGTILHYPIQQNGLFSAIPFLLCFLTALIASWITGYIEKNKTASTNFLRKFWILISSSLYSLCLLGTYIAGCNKDLSVIFSILSMGLSGIGAPGYMVVVQDMSPTFSGTLYSITNTFGYLSSVIFPLMVGYLTDGMQTLEQWNKVFFISIGIVMSSAIIFLIFGSAKIQPWNFVEEEDQNKDKKRPEKDEKVEMTRF